MTLGAVPTSWRELVTWQRLVAGPLNQLLQGHILSAWDTAPTSKNEGYFFYDTTLHGPRWYNGSAFKTVAALDSTFNGATFDLTDNTLTGTKAEFDTACSDGNFLYASTPITVTTISATAITASSLAATGNITSSGGHLGYDTGNGGTVTQSTDKSTAVTLNKHCGRITLNNATLNAGASVSFTLNNTAIEASDVLILNHRSGGTIGAYNFNAAVTSNSSASITVTNRTAGNLGEAVVIAFVVIRGVAA